MNGSSTKLAGGGDGVVAVVLQRSLYLLPF